MTTRRGRAPNAPVLGPAPGSAAGKAGQRLRSLGDQLGVRAITLGPAVHQNHPVVGTLRLNRDKLAAGEVILVLYYPDQDTESADKLSLLASPTTGSTV